MIKITIIGSGNVAQHLVKIISKTPNLELIQMVVRPLSLPTDFILKSKICTDFDTIKPADLYIIAVSDKAIEEVAFKLPFINKLVVHTSGSIGIDKIDNKNKRGVFYPLQTFTKNKNVDFKSIPICIEAETAEDYLLIEKVAFALSDKVYKINSVQRKALHVSAVFVCNFVNHLYQIGNTICDENQIPFEILFPLIQETAKKIETLAPIEAQTGPAKREDIETINSHLRFLSDENQQDIYKILTKSIIDNGKKL